ncbi:hypothetical protein C8A00DRAFT_36127 [Chaetomidium leptoderma]|uniref:Uncharacterized protein n=1 Tax=Chaetomidium leptoderma TaxID=669021 RepID=A0AAN6VH95_9PEZI|nr:hypothetical protein C8A00DRAFT_36127 [Chaetomidium leptoderma]
MAIAEALPFLALALSALYGTALAENSGQEQRPSWKEANCPFACVSNGCICCSDDVSYAMPGESCPEGTHPLPPAWPGSSGASGSGSVDHTSSVLVSTVKTSCTAVSVSATNEALASEARGF